MPLDRPELNYLAGWTYLLNRQYRERVHRGWRSLPAWVAALQAFAGFCSLLFPLMLIGLLLVFIL